MKKLSTRELEQLRAWQKRLVVVFLATMAGLFVAAAIDFAFGLSANDAVYVFSALLLLVLLSLYVQFSQKCPGCGYRLGFQTRLLLPEHCRKCGVALK